VRAAAQLTCRLAAIWAVWAKQEAAILLPKPLPQTRPTGKDRVLLFESLYPQRS